MIHAHDSLIVQTLSRPLLPLIQLYGLYVLFFGQYGPGGGFVGGVILGASMILMVLVFGVDASQSVMERIVFHADGLGLLLFAGVGGLCLILGGEFLNYAAVDVFGLEVPSRRSLGIVMTQVGVALDVAVTAISIVYSLSPPPEEDDADA